MSGMRLAQCLDHSSYYVSCNSNNKMNIYGHSPYLVCTLFSPPNQDKAKVNIQKALREVGFPCDLLSASQSLGFC